LPLADTSDMIGFHRIFRDALAAAPELVGGAGPDDAVRALLVASYYANVLELLHRHHEGEDELLTPRLLARAPASASTVARIGSQHHVVLAALHDAEQAITAWCAAPSVATRDTAKAALAVLEAGLTPHLDDEEREILPIAARHINVEEWGELPAHGMRSFGGDKMWLIIGLIQEQMTPEQKLTMEAHMPPPLLEFWIRFGRDMFTAFSTELGGPPRSCVPVEKPPARARQRARKQVQRKN
jgi:hypothetical protein